jgi:hypothetical protein
MSYTFLTGFVLTLLVTSEYKPGSVSTYSPRVKYRDKLEPPKVPTGAGSPAAAACATRGTRNGDSGRAAAIEVGDVSTGLPGPRILTVELEALDSSSSLIRRDPLRDEILLWRCRDTGERYPHTPLIAINTRMSRVIHLGAGES